MKTLNFNQHIKEPTRIIENSSTGIGLIFSNMHNYNKNWYIEKIHFNEYNIQNLKLQISKIDWSDITIEDKNINQNFDTFYKKQTYTRLHYSQKKY